MHERRIHPDILGISYSISSQELIELTNKARADSGLPPLSVNQSLSTAPQAKDNHMFSNNYWAHFAPDGTSPWYFIKNSGYGYVYAGENLAKGFTTSGDTVNAWMNSQSHRDNVLNKNYSDVGFAVVEGKLLGEDTVLVVEMFGSANTPAFAVAPQTQTPITTIVPTTPPENTVQGEQEEKIAEVEVIPTVLPVVPKVMAVVPQNSASFLSSVITKPVIDLQKVSGSIVFIIMLLFIVVLALDFAIIERKKIPRVVGHNIDHIVVIGLFVLLILLEKGGGILGL